MILGEDNRTAWSKLDVLIMQAYQILEDERCPQCGMYQWLCRIDDDPNLQIRISRDKCIAREEIEDANKSKKSDEYEGMIRPEFYTRDGRPLGDYRKIYRERITSDD